MKSIVRLGLTLSLLGGTVLGASLMQSSAVYALPEADALKRLEPIPVFTLTNAQGIPILASVPNTKDKTKKVQIATFFLSQQDAQALLTALKAQKPDVAKDAKILALSMRQAYDIKTKNKAKADSLVFEFLPPKKQIDAALTVLKQNGQNIKQFNDIPLFFAIGGADKGLLTIEQGANKVIPFYFNQQDLQGMLDQLKTRDPKLSSTTKMQVTTLSKIVDSLMKDNSAGIQQITLVPDRAALQYALQQQGPGGAKAPAKAGTAPATAPTTGPATAPATGPATAPATAPAKPMTAPTKTK